VIAERTRASDTPPYRAGVENIATLASAHRRANLAERLSAKATEWTGRTSAFTWALVVVVGWILSGPIFHYSDTWQLLINTITSLVTFLMVFLIQRAQNKDTLALQIKVNELIAAQKGAHNGLIAVEQLAEDDLRVLQERFQRLAEISRGQGTTSVATVPDVPACAPGADSAMAGSAVAVPAS
jgi:low affinity Fe/Cu permease